MPFKKSTVKNTDDKIAALLKKLKERSIYDGFIVVHVWRPRQGDQCRTSVRAITGGLAGHVSLSIFKSDGTTVYASFWPSISGKKANGSIGVMKSYAEDCLGEGGRPADISIPFFNLDLQKIEACFNELNCQCKKNKIKWVAQVFDHVSTLSEKQNCATLVWTILKAGGIERYHPQLKGPIDETIRKKYKCDEGSLLWRMFDNFSWRKSFVSPVLLLHLTASAREKERTFFKDTISLEEMVLDIFKPHADNSKVIISMDQLDSDTTKNNIGQLLIPFAFFGNRRNKYGVKPQQSASQRTPDTDYYAHTHTAKHITIQGISCQGTRTLFNNLSFSKYLGAAINSLRRIMR